METEGFLSPETAEAARRAHEELAPAANTVSGEVAKAMFDDSGELDERLTEEVVATAHDALFGSLLEVHVGSREEFDDWTDADGREVVLAGSEDVDGVVWHAPPFADRVVAATFQDERVAAVATLRRQAYGRLYADVLAEGR